MIFPSCRIRIRSTMAAASVWLWVTYAAEDGWVDRGYVAPIPSIRRHYPDYVLRVERPTLLSACLTGSPFY